MPAKEHVQWEDGLPFEEIDQIKEITAKSVELFKERGFTKLMPVQANTFHAIYNTDNVVA